MTRKSKKPVALQTQRPRGNASRYPGKMDGAHVGVRLTADAHKALVDLSESLAFSVGDTIEYCIRKTCGMQETLVTW